MPTRRLSSTSYHVSTASIFSNSYTLIIYRRDPIATPVYLRPFL
uniref:Uncharacterized protein n=1 Tax=Podoviridae sp. ctKmJ5 TaxID=2827732 RepID=A0A8S5SYN3_9CAUD|nr:MAG TPA: hypothetical protein [Podoviridae sp. ctKmJ5]